MLVPVLLFLLGFLLLIKGGDWFVDGATGIAHRFHLPELLIGATVVSIGTTLPEVMVSAQAAFQHNSGISYGNAIGSVICNTSLIAALTVAIRPGLVNKKSLRLPVVSFFLAAIVYSVIAYATGNFERWQGIVLLCGFTLYMVVTVLHMKKHPEDANPEADEEEKPKEMQLWQELLFLVVGAAAIAVGARLLVDNGTLIAEALGVPSSVIGLTMVALGTSLPELVTSVTAARKGNTEVAIGNVVGSSILNVLFVLGMSGIVAPIPFAPNLLLDGVVTLAATALVWVLGVRRRSLGRGSGVAMLASYAAYMAHVINFA